MLFSYLMRQNNEHNVNITKTWTQTKRTHCNTQLPCIVFRIASVCFHVLKKALVATFVPTITVIVTTSATTNITIVYATIGSGIGRTITWRSPTVQL